MSTAAGLALALASAAALNWGWIAQHGAAGELPPLSVRRPLRSLALLFRDLRWLAGSAIGLAGWALYIAALALAPLSLVQATAAGGVAILAVLAHRRGARLTQLQWRAVAIATGGLVLLGASLAHGASGGIRASWVAVAVWVAVSALVAAAAAGASTAALAGGAGLGIAAGILYAAGDVATKGAVGGGAPVLLVPLVLATHGAAFVCLQIGFQRGDALATAGTATLLTNALPIVAGIALLHEAVPSGALGVARVLAFASVVLAAALLARPQA